ncbi:MAG: AraC family transcriptional regulator [Alistipes sp.]|nr:AraC family transcriptional regulator [Alistipes sp.]
MKFKLDMVEHDLPKPSNIARIMCGQILMLEEASDDFDGIVVVMSNSFVEGLLVHIDNALPLQAKMLGHNSVKPLSESEKALPEMFLKAAYQVLKDDENPFRRNVLEHVILAIFYSSEEVRKQFDGDSSGYSSAESITKEFLKLVKVNFRSERQLQFYSDKLCITPRYLSRVVKESTGSSAADWIERYVVLEARALLKSTNMTIQQISDDLNFPSQTFFGKYFKRRVGVSPKCYRREG